MALSHPNPNPNPDPNPDPHPDPNSQSGSAFGWETGRLFTGGKMNPQKMKAQSIIFNLMLETGVFEQLITEKSF